MIVPLLKNATASLPPFGDHLLIIVDFSSKIAQSRKITKRNWNGYSPEKLITTLSQHNLLFENDSVQEYWNSLENVLINVIDQLTPLVEYNEVPFRSQPVPPHVKSIINKRDRLLKKNKTKKCPVTTTLIKNLNNQIKNHFFNKKNIVDQK